MKTKTYWQAQTEIINYLQDHGWSVDKTLKVPHATKDNVRLYFKSQSIYMSRGSRHTLNDARSLFVSPKTECLDCAKFEQFVINAWQ